MNPLDAQRSRKNEIMDRDARAFMPAPGGNPLVKRLLNPTVILPTLLSAALLASLLALSNGKTVWDTMARALPQAMIPVALLTLL